MSKRQTLYDRRLLKIIVNSLLIHLIKKYRFIKNKYYLFLNVIYNKHASEENTRLFKLNLHYTLVIFLFLFYYYLHFYRQYI